MDVTVVDRFGAPLEGVTVKLTGVVDRDAISDHAGFATFGALPDGRYDVVATQKGLVPSAPRVLDVPSFGVMQVAITLKPRGRSPISDACGGFDPSSIITLAATAHLVLHVKVTDQRTLDSARPEDEPFVLLRTTNRVQVLQSFTRGVRAPVAGAQMTIVQGGGRIDRGDRVDVHRHNGLDPLNVGDEYVLFVYVDSVGTNTILGSEEGVFRVRNGRVDPLGRGGAATTWKGRSAQRFFEALRTLP